MDKKGRAILARFPGRKKGSQLAPHRDLICRLHQRGYTLGEIVHILSDNFNLAVVPSTVFRFIARTGQDETNCRKNQPRKEKPVPIIPTVPEKPMPVPMASHDDIRQRIAALKQQTTQLEPDKRRFEYDPDQPLHLVQEEEKA